MALEDIPQGARRSRSTVFNNPEHAFFFFFLGWGPIWCESITDQSAKVLAQPTSHSPCSTPG